MSLKSQAHVNICMIVFDFGLSEQIILVFYFPTTYKLAFGLPYPGSLYTNW